MDHNRSKQKTVCTLVYQLFIFGKKARKETGITHIKILTIVISG